ncbi:ester cyclase [Planotetraspora sp. A-T 1434]|uniref:nuclear transport factor 2 family protein n=1 Tax=Planotetraspora sp. A-T 1434 TaxID=2979219 RepID=UPI0021BE5FF0|nr:ester cyclase [Planotetraspora sp. A-T 1434]MCT9935025.1 ester cyclase [Planotetraspora sp. A-T 1434]
MSDAEVVDRLMAAITNRDLEAVVRCYSPNAVAVGPQGVAEGRDEIAAYHAQAWEAFPNASVMIWKKNTFDDLVVVEMSSTVTHTGPFLLPSGEMLEPTGKNTSMRSCWVFTVEDDLVATQRVYYDQMELYSQLGAKLDSPET